MKKLTLSIFSSLLVLSTSTYATQLTEVLDNALTTNPVIKERLQNYEKTAYDLKIAKSEYQPTLDFVGKYGYEKTLTQIGGPNDKGYHTYQNSLVLTQNLFNGLKTKYRVKFEEARVLAAAYNYIEQTNDVAYNVVKNYIDVIKYDELLLLEKENVLLTQDILDKTKELMDAGSGLVSDVKKVDSSLQLAEFNLLTQQNNLMDAQYNLSRLTGTKINKDELEFPNYNLKVPSTQEEALQHAIKYNPSMIVTNYNIETAKAQLVQERTKFSPTIDFELSYNFDRNTAGDEGHTRSYSALVVYRHNLYNGQADINSVRKSKMNIKQEYEIQRDIKRQIIEGLQLSWSAYTMIQKQIIFLNSYLEQSKATLDLYKEEFEAGTRTLIDLLSAQDDYISAKSKLISANYDLTFSKFRVLDAMGEMVNTVFEGQTKEYYKPAYVDQENINDYELQDRSDLDRDNVNDVFDICDSTNVGDSVDVFGCSKPKDDIVKAIPTNLTSLNDTIVENNQEKITSNNILENATNGFTISVATFSSKKIVDNFLKNSKLDKNDLSVIKYTTKKSKKDLYKIVYGVFDSKQEARKTLASLPRIVKVNKPYLANISKVKNEYFN